MKKILLSSLLLSSIIFADKIQIPMSASSLAVENSGSLSAIDAYQDGIGIYTVENVGGTVIDNSEMNSLVYKYGAEAKVADVSIKDYIISSGNAAEKVLASSLGKFEPIMPDNNTVCDDGNNQTINDIYTNGNCVGENVEGQPCNDNNSGTVMDKYTNGVCTSVLPYTCKEILTDRGTAPTTNYTLYKSRTDTSTAYTAYCDMSAAGGGWTKIYTVDKQYVWGSGSFGHKSDYVTIPDPGFDYNHFMLVDRGSWFDIDNTLNSWYQAAGISSRSMTFAWKSQPYNTRNYLINIKNSSLSDAGTLRECMIGSTTYNDCHSIFVGNTGGQKLYTIWEEESNRANIGMQDFTEKNTVKMIFDVYVRE